ncbi:MAG: tRNA (adenosine(37)-N6)-threonylcarbamoyltransferase complex transferase subunit TsaD [Rhodospirillales bacterium]|nr:tRNA (adenosine(37)-N6)-threonylcarbamoyltransferase complex transferase subunit TsaD [Rhodospirillales bacterium]
MYILGIETSCDETAAAIVCDDHTIRSNVVLSQIKEHRIFGGVVPEIAARAHLDHLDKIIAAAMDEANITFADLDGVAATCGPGLIGGVMVGMMAGKAIAAAHNLPFIAVNHLEAHALTPRLSDNVAFPYLLLLVSGGHTQLLIAEDVGRYRQLGTTLDDALGECFDKSAKLMGLPYPGGPNLEKIAAECPDPAGARERFPLPRPLKGRKNCDFSFSGLKTAIRTHVDNLPEGDLNRADIAALASAFQQTAAEIICDRVGHALDDYLALCKNQKALPSLVIAGGVAANKAIRSALEDLTNARETAFIAPPIPLCSDNGAMIAWAGIERLKRDMIDTLDVPARPRWPLDPQAARKKGAAR